MVVSVSTPASVGGGGTSITLSAYTVPAGADKILTVEISIEDNDPETVDTVEFDGVSLTQRKRDSLDTGIACVAELWDLQLGSTTPSGDIVATLGAAVSRGVVAALTAIGVAQQAPEADAAANSETSPIDTAITTVTAGALIIDALSEGQGSGLSVTQGPDQVEDIDQKQESSGLGVSHRIGGSAGSHTLGWSQTGPNRLVHVLVAYEEAAAPGGGRIMSSLAGHGGLVYKGGIAGAGGGLAA